MYYVLCTVSLRSNRHDPLDMPRGVVAARMFSDFDHAVAFRQHDIGTVGRDMAEGVY